METITPAPDDARLLVLASEIQTKLASIPTELDEKAQHTLARLLGLLYDLRKPEFMSLIPEWEIAVRSLLASSKNQPFAENLLDRIRNKIHPSLNPITALVRGGSPPTRVIFGLGTLLYFALPLAIILLPRIITREAILGVPSEMLVAVGLFGALGSIVSIMVRIQDFGKAADVDPSVLYMTGFFKPIVGMSFALFIFAVIKAGLIPITISQGGETYFFIALAFMSGFSERFASDVASSAEKRIQAAS